MKHKLKTIMAIIRARSYVLITNKTHIIDVGGGPSDDDDEAMSMPEQITRQAREMRDRLGEIIKEVERVHNIVNKATGEIKRPRTKAKSKR
jgi:hypothetical protein